MSFGNFIGGIGTSLKLPEFGLSELFNGQDRFNNKISNVNPNMSAADSLGQIQQTGAANLAPTQDQNSTVQGTYQTPEQQYAAQQADQNAAAMNQGKTDVQNRIGSLQGLYGQLFGNIDQNVTDQRSQYDKGYNTQQGQLNNDYQGSMGQIGQIMAGRGLADSSYLGDAQGQATNQYNTGLDQLNQGRDNAYSQLGKFATTQKQQLGAGQQQLGQIGDLGQYDLAGLQNLRNTLDSHIANAQSTQAGLGTNAQYQTALQAATPAATQGGSAALAAQLQKLKTSGASPLITGQIAQGLIKSAGKQDDPYIQNLWQSLQGV